MSLPRYQPMLASPWPRAFAGDEWLFEPKWDGIRGLLYAEGGRIEILTRTGRDVSGRYPELSGLGFKAPIVLDGELVVLDSEGRASFERLQQRGTLSTSSLADHPVSFVVFDVLHVGGRSTTSLPIEGRHALLDEVDLPAPLAKTTVTDDGLAMWDVVRERDLEGIVAKRRGSSYRPGVRSPDWRKIPHLHTVKALVGGYTRGDRGRAGTFGALALGLRRGDALRWIGSVGAGFSNEALVAIRGTLDRMERVESPFHADPEAPALTFVEPVLVAAVAYRNWTTAGRIRQPRFKGFTDDAVEGITWEAEGPDR